MLEGCSFDEFLNSAADLSLVSPGVYPGHVGHDGAEEFDDLVEAGLVLFSDGWRDGGVYAAKSAGGKSVLLQCP